MLLSAAPREKTEVGLVRIEGIGLQAQVSHHAEGNRTPNGTRNPWNGINLTGSRAEARRTTMLQPVEQKPHSQKDRQNEKAEGYVPDAGTR